MTVVNPAIITAPDNQIPSDVPTYYISSDVSPNNSVSMNSANATIEMAGGSDPAVEISAMHTMDAAAKSAAATEPTATTKAAAAPRVRVGKKGAKTNKD